MHLTVLACDLNGTLAQDGRVTARRPGRRRGKPSLSDLTTLSQDQAYGYLRQKEELNRLT